GARVQRSASNRFDKIPPDEQVVTPAAKRAAGERRDDRNPPPAVAGAKNLAAPSRDRREQARPEIAGRVDRVARVEAERRADQDDEQPDNDRRESGRRGRVARVGDAEDARDEQRSADDLIDETTREAAQERLRIRGPDAGGPLRPEHVPDAAVERVDRL